MPQIFEKILNLISFLVFTYQTILLTRDYCEFQTVIDLKLIESKDYLPAISICFDYWKRDNRFYPNNSGSLTISKIFGRMHCALFNASKNAGIKNKCNKLTDLVESFTDSGKKCLTLFSRLYWSTIFNGTDFILTLILYKPIHFYLLIHQNITPPHLNRNFLRIDKNSMTVVGFRSITEELLPYPYETNCFKYHKNLEKRIFYQSKEDCIVNYLRRKELEKCGCNRKWIYYKDKKSEGVKICPKANKCNFKNEFDESIMLCRKSCYNKYYDSEEDGKLKSRNGFQHIILVKHKSREISLTHSEKMNLNGYLSSIGGLMSMWFGLCLYKSFLFILKILKSFIEDYIFLSLYLESIINWILFRIIRLKKYFRLAIILIFSIGLLFQMKDLFVNYFKYDAITRIEINDKEYCPELTISLGPIIQNLTKLKDIYPGYEKLIDQLLIEDGLFFSVKKLSETWLLVLSSIK
jgi:hypothetical protein